MAKILAAISAGLILGTACWGAQYRYPAELPVKPVYWGEGNYGPFRTAVTSGKTGNRLPIILLGVEGYPENSERHRNLLRLVHATPSTGIWASQPFSAVTLHVRYHDGSDLSILPTMIDQRNDRELSVSIEWWIDIPGAEAGDSYPAYISHEAGKNKWTTEEFLLLTGGSGNHEKCGSCFDIKEPQSQSSPGGRVQSPPGWGRGGVASRGAAHARVQDLLDVKAAAFQDTSVELDEEIVVYEPEGLQPMGRVKPGMNLLVSEEVAPGFARVRFSTSSGQVYEGAVKVTDLVPRHTLHVALRSKAVWIHDIPEEFAARSSELQTLRLCCVGQDGVVKELVPKTSGKISGVSHYVTWDFSPDVVQRGEYLCYLLHGEGTNTWTSQAFGLRCGPNETLGYLPQRKVDEFLAKLVARKNAQKAMGKRAIATGDARGSAKEDGAVLRDVVSRRVTEIYSLRELPEERLMGKVPSGVTLHVMEDLGGGYLRVRFTLPNGREVEGAAKKGDVSGVGR